MNPKVMLDSNIIIMLGQGIITLSMFYDILEQKVEMITTSSVVEELKKIADLNKNKKIYREINFGLSIINTGKIQIINTTEIDADDSIFHASLELKNKGETVYVATNDKELRSRLRIVGIPTIYYRNSKSILEVEWRES
ncbi:PIN domain-containing protein [Caldisphaera sp.]|uniref:PIN domain-containing protein n=1 Tax=Caldisphaera sp. TaxID=2060322 RepID=UPI0025C59BCA|nr:PIN domain-containing protein [Caldisphaera sp.]